MVQSNGSIKLEFNRLTPDEQEERLQGFIKMISKRRSVRQFSSEPINEEVLEKVIHTAGTAPSGANQQPWTYILIKDSEVKKRIRQAAEQEEREQLKNATLSLDYDKSYLADHSYLETAPYLIALFRQNYGLHQLEDGSWKKVQHYYAHESAPISAGFLLSALQNVGIDSVIHAPVAASKEILNRPKNEAPIMLFAVGYGEEGFTADELERKGFHEILVHGAEKIEEPTRNYAPPYSREKVDHLQLETADTYYEIMKKRRNIRDFSTEFVDIKLIYKAIEAAMTAPSGGNLQPYRYAIISDMESKIKIRELAEIEEKKLYEERISDEWREALAPLGTNWMKPHLTDAPHLLIAFKVEEDPVQAKVLDSSLLHPKHSYAIESASISVGILMNAIHHAGLFTLTHTPSPMFFLRDFLNRPKQELPFLVLPVGYPVENCHVPDITKKPLSEILVKV